MAFNIRLAAVTQEKSPQLKMPYSKWPFYRGSSQPQPFWGARGHRGVSWKYQEFSKCLFLSAKWETNVRDSTQNIKSLLCFHQCALQKRTFSPFIVLIRLLNLFWKKERLIPSPNSKWFTNIRFIILSSDYLQFRVKYIANSVFIFWMKHLFNQKYPSVFILLRVTVTDHDNSNCNTCTMKPWYFWDGYFTVNISHTITTQIYKCFYVYCHLPFSGLFPMFFVLFKYTESSTNNIWF